MIHTFRSSEAAQLHARQPVKRLQHIARPIQRSLLLLDAAAQLRDLEATPGNHVEALTGDRQGQHTIRITDALRLCFVWCGAACDVEFTNLFEGSHLPFVPPRVSTAEKLAPAPTEKLPPIHPGEILAEDFLRPLDISMNRLALDVRVPVTRIAEIVHGRRAITPDTALRLGRYFNTSARFWMNAQSTCDLELAEDKLQAELERDVRPRVD
jgi:addiction module HigA family antidote